MAQPLPASLPATRRGDIREDGRETVALLRGCKQTINLVLVALTDGVELEIWADGRLRRRSRFLRDTVWVAVRWFVPRTFSPRRIRPATNAAWTSEKAMIRSGSSFSISSSFAVLNPLMRGLATESAG